MKLLLSLALPLALLTLPAHGQDQATTLLAACERADVVVRATVLAASDPSPEWHRLEFRTDEVLHGQIGSTFALLEPAGACCGRSLFALVNGNDCLLFLQRRGATLHPFGGARGVLAAEPAVIAHVRSLLAATNDHARARILVTALQNETPRVAEDAAHSLATLPSLQLSATDRDTVVATLGAALERGNAVAASLADVVVRLEDATVLDALLPLYLDQPRADRARLLRQALVRCTPQGLVDRLPMHLHGDEQRELRAVELLADLPTDDARPMLHGMLAVTHSPRVQLCVCEGLLATGTQASTLRGRVPATVLALAERRRNGTRTFRNLRPHNR